MALIHRNRIKSENADLLKDNRRLRHLCNEKDSYFLEMISDGLRHGSSLAAKHMADRRQYLRIRRGGK